MTGYKKIDEQTPRDFTVYYSASNLVDAGLIEPTNFDLANSLDHLYRTSHPTIVRYLESVEDGSRAEKLLYAAIRKEVGRLHRIRK